MGNLFNLDNPFFTFLSKLVDAFLLSMLWLVCCIPLFTIGASTTAFYYTVNKVLRRGQGYLTQEFFHSFKQNFKQSTILWLIFAVLGLIFRWDAFLMQENIANGMKFGGLYPVFYAFLGMELMVIIYVFPYLARFENTTKQILKNGALLAIAHFPKTIVCFLIVVVSGLMIYLLPILICILPAGTMMLLNVFLEKIFYRYMSEEQRMVEDQKNNEY